MSKTYQGVIAVGKDRDTAIANYRAAKLGENALVMESADQQFITVSDFHSLFNPFNGELDLEQGKLPDTFVSENAVGSQANWKVCADGCGSHIVYEKESTDVKFCPACASSLDEPSDADSTEDTQTEDDSTENTQTEDAGESTEADEEDLEDGDVSEEESSESADDTSADTEETSEEESDEDLDEDTSGEDLDEDSSDDEAKEVSLNGAIVVAATAEKAKALYRNVIRGKGAKALHSESGNTYLTSVSESLSFDPADGESLLSDVDSFELSTSEEDYLTKEECHHLVCSSSDGCGSHVISSKSIGSCPVCSSKLSDPVSTSEDDDTEEDVVEQDTEDLSNDEPSDEVSMNLLDDAEDENLSVSFTQNFKQGKDAWLASLNGMPVAYATRDEVGNNNDIFDNPAFGKAVISQSKNGGSKAALKQFGFKPFVLTAKVSQKVEEEVGKQVAVAKAELEVANKQYQERFLAALSTAAVGLNRGFFAGIQNPLKAKLWESLNTVGVQEAEVLIDNVFSLSSDAYHKALFDKTADILSKPVEVQDELANTVLATNYMRASQSSSAATTVTGQIGTKVSTSATTKEESKIPALLQGLKFGKF